MWSRLRSVFPAVAASVLLATALLSCTGVAAAAGPVDGHEQLAPLSSATPDAVTQRAVSLSSHGANVFSPAAQPPVVLLVGSGLVALCVLVLMRLRETLLPGSTTSAVDEEPWKPVSDPDRVEQLLVANDGYMKQSRIVEETDWSKAKVSRLLTRMAEEGRVRKDKDGRENIIILEQ